MIACMQYIIINWYDKNKTDFADSVPLTEKEIKKGCKKIFDKLVVRIIINELESEMIISAILNLHELERIVIKIYWKVIITTIIIQNAKDVLTCLSSRLRASGKTNLDDSEDEEDSQSESLLMSEDTEDNKNINITIEIDEFFFCYTFTNS